MKEIHCFLPVSENPDCDFDLKLCERLFNSDHVDYPFSPFELVQSVSNIAGGVERGPIRPCERQGCYLKCWGETQLLTKVIVLHGLTYVELPGPTFAMCEASFFEPIEQF